MWKSIYRYVFPLWPSVTYRPKMRSKQTLCSVRSTSTEGVLPSISQLMGILVDFLRLSVDHQVIKSKYVIWQLFKAAEMALCTQHTKHEGDGGRY